MRTSYPRAMSASAWLCCWIGQASRLLGVVLFRVNPASRRALEIAVDDHVSPSCHWMSARSWGAVSVHVARTRLTIRFFVSVGMADLDFFRCFLTTAVPFMLR